jgi:hypothetical protein
MENNEKQDCFFTPDIYQCAFLLVRNHPLAGISWHTAARWHKDSHGKIVRRALFSFNRTAALEKTLTDFHANVPVPIRDFLSGVYSAKRQLKEFENAHLACA